jgi:hypothetical protein
VDRKRQQFYQLGGHVGGVGPIAKRRPPEDFRCRCLIATCDFGFAVTCGSGGLASAKAFSFGSSVNFGSSIAFAATTGGDGGSIAGAAVSN